MRSLYYVVKDNGYHIYDHNDSGFHIHQYEPYIPDRTLTYEENAQAQIDRLIISYYVSAVINEEIDILDVSEQYRDAVDEIVNRTIAKMELEQKAQAYDILMGVSE